MIINGLIFLSAIALLIKAALFAVAKGNLFIKNKMLAVFLVLLFVLNFIEFLSFSLLQSDTTSSALFTLKVFYVVAVFSATAYLIFSIQLSVYHKPLFITLIMVSSAFSAVIMSGDAIIAGITTISYSTTRIEGEYYWLLRAFLLLLLTTTLAVLIYNSINNEIRIIRQRSTVLLLSTMPFVLATLSIIILMWQGYQLNATIVISLSTSFMMVVLIFTEARYRLFQFLSFIPFTHEYRLRTKANRLIDQMIKDLFDSNKTVNYKDIRSELETVLIELAIESTGGNKTHAAKQLGIGKATLHRKIEGLQI